VRKDSEFNHEISGKIEVRQTLEVHMDGIDFLNCFEFPCTDVVHEKYAVPKVKIQPESVKILMISEAAAARPEDNYYAGGESLFERTTLMAFQDAGAPVHSFQDVLDLGVYLTTAVKCGKTGYAIQTSTIESCSHLLETELGLFPNVEVYLLMGDVAIKSFNRIAKRKGEGRVIPAGSTYKIRGQAYYYRGKRVFPTYLQAGPAFFIEKSKRQMIAEDIRAALALAGAS
jgi:uracil-DNA glycosylase